MLNIKPFCSIYFQTLADVPPAPHKKITTVYLEDDTLTLWRPSQTDRQYNLISGQIKSDDVAPVLQTYYTKFDCVTSILRFDDAVPIFSNQSTTIQPTDDYSILRDYHSIQGLWFRPDSEEQLDPEEETTLGNFKLAIPLSKDAKESMFSTMKIYFLEVLDYPAEDKSVSRLLLTRSVHDEFEKYDIHKPGGPIYVINNMDDLEGEVEIYYLRVCHNFAGRRWRHEVEFMMEEDPWPMCKILPVNSLCFRRPTISVARDVSASLPCRYIGATWRETLAGLFAWSLRTHLGWLIFERLHHKVKAALDRETNDVNIQDVIHTECPVVCQEMFDIYDLLATFIAKCENEQDMRDLLNVFFALHRCETGNCTLVSLKSLNSSRVLPGILYLLEKTIACASPQFRYDVTSSILPWSVMGYYCSDLKIRSHRKMVIFISQLHGINTDLERPGSPEAMNGRASSGYGSAPVTPRSLYGIIQRKRSSRRGSQVSSVSSTESVEEEQNRVFFSN